MTVDLRPHQSKAVEKLGNGKILNGDAGSGKTRVAFQYYIKKESPRDVIVITTAKKRDSLDWEEEGAKQGVGADRGATLHGTLTVDSWNNIAKYNDVRDAFFIFDEQRVVGSGAWVKAFYKVAKANRWILLSATPGDTWMDYIPVFVANGLYKNKTEFLREHVVFSYYGKFPKVERYIGVRRLVQHRNDLLVDMPFDRHTTRHINRVLVEHDESLFQEVVKKRWHVFESRPLKDVAELFSVMRKVVNTDASRLEAVRSLTMTHPKLIVFYNFDYELELLRKIGDNAWTSPSSSEQKASPLGSSPSPSSATNSHPAPASSLKSQPTAETQRCPWRITDGCTCPTKRRDTCLTIGQDFSKTPGLVRSPSYERSVSRVRGTSSTTSTLTETPTPSSSKTRTAQSGDTGAKPRTGSTTPPRTTPSVPFAEWNGHKHQPIPETDRWVYLVQYTAGAEGWNCIETDACVFFSLNYSYRVMEQCMGRIDRMNTPFFDLFYYVFRSESAIDKAIWKTVLKKENFNEKRSAKSDFRFGREFTEKRGV